MTTSSSERARPTPLTQEAAETLVGELVAEMIRQWQQGERLLPEDFLTRHPELWEHPEAVADLIYEELCLRQEHGPEVPLEQVLRRFPQWRPQLEVLFDCQRVLGPPRAAPQFPAAGEALDDFFLLAELGRGAQGRVFLASQLSLGERPVVLKLLPLDAREHLSLARLQHTHIVPLYSAQDHPVRKLRALCMPYFGGATLARVLDALAPQPPARRTGQDLLDALDRAQAAVPLTAPARGRARQSLARATYVQAVCGVAACLADALQYAHERGLVHLDLKPSNVLLAADGQPMLLDFHLAREPLHPDDEGPPWLGGTAGYMSPEQRGALEAAKQGRKVPRVVDGRSDIYSLGVLLYEALAGGPPAPAGQRQPLNRRNAQVSVGLADVVGKCLADDPERRYPDMAALARDLRRHLADLPLAGVRNRSLLERWRKWRRRRPYRATLGAMMFAVLIAAGAVALGAVSSFNQRLGQARDALHDGKALMAQGQWGGAIRALQRGQASARGLLWQQELRDSLDQQLRLAEQGQAGAARDAAARELNQLADRVRFLYGAEGVAPEEALRGLESPCRDLWDKRARVVRRLGAGAPEVRDDLLDLAIFWADLRVRLARPAEPAQARREALTVLDQAEALFGPSPVLDEERKLHGGAGLPRAGKGGGWGTAWEHYALGRALLRSGDLKRAADEVARAVRLEPQGLWPNFYQGLCAYRQGRYEDAVTAYSVCIGAAPRNAEGKASRAAGCFYNRALAFVALGRTKEALRDYDQARRLDPSLELDGLKRQLLLERAKQ
jgi:eukaryotic-like serine/threonine-protein kinase